MKTRSFHVIPQSDIFGQASFSVASDMPSKRVFGLSQTVNWNLGMSVSATASGSLTFAFISDDGPSVKNVAASMVIP
jgi:hypothetical protein